MNTISMRLLGLVMASGILVVLLFINMYAALLALSIAACTSDLPTLYDSVIRERQNFLEHLWAVYGWPIWGVYACLRLKN